MKYIKIYRFPLGSPRGAYRLFGLEVAAAVGIGTAVAGLAGAAVSSSATNSASRRAQASTSDTNAANLQIARETNQANIDIANETNRTNIDLQNKQNQFNIEQWNRNNLYNSPEMSKQRLMQAGFNPALYGMDGQNYSVQPVQQVSIPKQSVPNLVTPTMQSSAPSIMQAGLEKAAIFSNLMSDIAGASEKVMSAKEKNANTNLLSTRNDVEKAMKSLNIELTKKQTDQITANINLMQSNIEVNQKLMMKYGAEIDKLDAETKGQLIDNIYKDKHWQSSIDLLKGQLNWTDAQVAALQERLPYEIGLIKAQTGAAKSQEVLNKSQAQLNNHQIAQVDAMVSLLTAQGEGQMLANSVARVYGMDIAESEVSRNFGSAKRDVSQAHLSEQQTEESKANTAYTKFKTDSFIKYTSAAANIIGSVGVAAGAVLGAMKFARTPIGGAKPI